MKKNIQKIIGLFFVFVFLFVAHTSYAAVSWNTGGDDCPTTNIANAETRIGWAHPCWTGTTVSAEPGQRVSVRVYYHNTGDQTATNVRIVLNAPTINNSSRTHSFSGQIISDQGSRSFGPVYVTLSSPQTLSHIDTAWYTKNKQELATSLPSGYTKDSVLSGGINIGSVPATMLEQGSFRVDFRVGNTTSQQCPPGTTGTYPHCTPIQDTMSGILTSSVAHCYIPVNSDSCPIRFVWQTFSPIGISSITTNGQTLATGNNDSETFEIPFGEHRVYLYNSSKELDHEDVKASCVAGTEWSDSASVCKTKTTTYCGPGTELRNGQCVPIYENTCSIRNFTINGSSSAQVGSGYSAYLSWDTDNCHDVTISNIGSNNVGESGSRTVYPYNDTSYRLRAYGPNGQTETRTVYAYTNSYNNNQCTISYFNANPTSINQGGSSYLTWNTNNCSSVQISNIGSVSTSGSQTVYPYTSTNYTLTAYGNNGTPSQSVYISVNNQNYNTNCAATNVATSVGTNSAQLNGVLTGANSANTYFQYGTTTSFGYQTPGRATYGSSTFSESIQGLSANTTYYYRLVTNCGNGQSIGNTQFLTTNGQTIIDRVIQTFVPQRVVQIQQPQVINTVGTISPIVLEITNRYEAIGEGDVIDYTIKYKNIGNTVLTKSLLQVIVPSGITLTNASSNGSYLNADKTLSFELNDIYPGAEGILYAQGLVTNISSTDAKIVSKALLVYTTPNNTQENAIAYVTNVPKDFNGSVLGAAAFFGGLFSMGLIGWLLLIILILIIILLVRIYMNRVEQSNINRHDMNHNHNNHHNANNQHYTDTTNYGGH